MSESVLLVEDDVALREVTALHLRGGGYRVEAVASGDEALDACSRARPDIVVLDLMLPGRDGLDVCRTLRSLYSPSPGVIMVTARGAEADMVVGFDAGADDYVVKPFAPSVLLARVAALARRLRGTEPVARFRTLTVDERKHIAVANGSVLSLTPTELALLARLCREPGRVITRKQLLSDVFGTQNESYSRNVDCHVTRLRRKLERAGLDPAPIHAVPGTGYRLGDP